MRLILGGDLQRIYAEVYRLVSRAHFTPEYVETLAPVERQVYLMEYEQDIQTQNESENEEGSSSRLLGSPKDYTG